MAETLTDQELEVLEGFLANAMETCNCMPLDTAHGYLTAVISGPVKVAASEWLPGVLGDIERHDLPQSSHARELLMRLYEGIQEELVERNYAPLLVYLTEGKNTPLPLPYGWSEGYLKGWELHGEAALNQMLQDEQAELLLAPIMVFLMYEEDQLLNPLDEQMHRDTVAELTDSAQGIYDWWLARSELTETGLQ